MPVVSEKEIANQLLAITNKISGMKILTPCDESKAKFYHGVLFGLMFSIGKAEELVKSGNNIKFSYKTIDEILEKPIVDRREGLNAKR